jgi:sugar phosphate isomerase/epimerase
MPTPPPGSPLLGRLSLNQRTTANWTVGEAIAGAHAAGLPAIGLWREPVAEWGLDRTVAAVRDAGLRVSSLCRGGFFTDEDAEQFRLALAENREAIEEAAALGTDCLVLVPGGLPQGRRDLPAARQCVVDAIGELVPSAREAGVRLAIEPMHPIFAADRGVISTLAQALDIAELFTVDEVGVVVDTYHVWWDPDVVRDVLRAGPRIASYQVCDWITPLPADTLLGRGMMGDGHIDFGPTTEAVSAAGYSGDVEVEIFNAEIWAAPGADVVATLARRYAELIAPHL